ncbi:uncharacterized protein LOC128765018 [Synchiropus splendidus]|uniref:uncharacterized protein LOC128765018 n=1 Tax=Synchiropus splendidus TaxID=270530 RepID=UPI00237DF9B6|nr:uncharacterized protein LOC128765018 [Synchiropus splendidus]
MAAIKMKALFLLFLSPAWALARVETVYFTEGGQLRLKPPDPPVIKDLTWKIEGSLAAEWSEGTEVILYRTFKGRATLDTQTGELVVRDARPEFAGEFKVEINNNQFVTNVSWRTELIKEVPVPRVEPKPLACSEKSDQCSLRCEGDTAGVGPVTYQWRMDDGDWEDGDVAMVIHKDETGKAVKEFRCRLKNPLGQKDSEPVHNPLARAMASTVNVPGAVVGSLVLVLAGGGLAAWCVMTGKYKKYFRVGQGEQPAAADK